MHRRIRILALLLSLASSRGQAQLDLPELYDIGGEFAFVRIQYDSYSKKIMSMKVNRKDFNTINGEGHLFEESPEPRSKIPKHSVKSL